jgi:c-di-GMP-binding flagellar brake protein YcgR
MLAKLANLIRGLWAWFRKPPARASRPEYTHERRKWERLGSEAQITISAVLENQDAKLKARVRDVSQGGICLVGNLLCAEGDLLHLTPAKAVKDQTNDLLACVVRVTDGLSNTWFLGCTFIRELSVPEVRAFL